MSNNDQSPQRNDLVLVPSVISLKDSILRSLRKDLNPLDTHSIRWEGGSHAAFKPSASSANSTLDDNEIDEIKVYWPVLNEKVRQSYGLCKEIVIQELEYGDIESIPIGEYPDLTNVKSHVSFVRNRSSSIKSIFGISSKADAGGGSDDEGGSRGSSPSGKILRRNSSTSSKGDASPQSSARKMFLNRNSIHESKTSIRSSPSSVQSSVSSRPSPTTSISFPSNNRRTSMKLTQSFLSFRKRILIESVSPDYFRELTHTFDSRAAYLQAQPNTLLPKIVMMIRLSSSNGRLKNSQKKKAYYVLTILPFPTENHEHVFSLSLKGCGIENGEKIGTGPFSESIFLADGDFAREHELVVSSMKRVQLVAQLASDLGHLQHHGRLFFSVICVATQRDPVLGCAYLPGAPLGPEKWDECSSSRERSNTLRSRHDLPLRTFSTPNSLIPHPTCGNIEQPLWEYYFSVHEHTGKVSSYSGSWTDWFSGKLGAHQHTSRLLTFIKEKMFIDGGDS